MRIGIYAGDGAQVERLARELSGQVLWAAGPGLEGPFLFPCYDSYEEAQARDPVTLIIDCLGGLRDLQAQVVPLQAALALLGTRAGGSGIPGTAAAQLVASIESILEQLGRLTAYSEKMSRLGAKLSGAAAGIAGDLERTGAILDSISRIAKRSKIIGLNSAIEAARVGEQGRGFAVVAEEIKTLADDSAQSIQGIERILAGIRQRSGEFSTGTSSVNELSALQKLAATEIAAALQGLKELGQNLKKISQDQSA